MVNVVAIALGVGLIAASPSHASIIQLNVSGGSGLDQGDLCATTTGPACSSTNATFELAGGAAAVGSFSYNSSADTVSFTLTLTQNANFGAETLLAGSTFSGSAVPVALSTLSKTTQQITQTGSPLDGTASLSFSPGLAMIEGTPAISALSCSLGSKVDTCAVSLGAGGLEVGPDASGVDYNTFLTFNVNAVPVPLPASAWLLLLGVGGSVLLGRRGNAFKREF
jgi:hypothetical protein